MPPDPVPLPSEGGAYLVEGGALVREVEPPPLSPAAAEALAEALAEPPVQPPEKEA